MTGLAQAVDGDTLRIGDKRIRLVGFDAPELAQSCVDPSGRDWACGMAAKAFLAELIDRDPVTCTRAGRDAYGRILASCVVAGEDLGARIVGSGWAVADFSYIAQEGGAHAAGLGIWSGSFVPPAQWRQTHRNDAPGVWEWIRSWFQ